MLNSPTAMTFGYALGPMAVRVGKP